MNEKARRSINISDCPGMWYGVQPTWENHAFGQGHVIVDPVHTEAALRWLKRRYFVTVRRVTTDQGLFIDLALVKGAPKPEPISQTEAA